MRRTLSLYLSCYATPLVGGLKGELASRASMMSRSTSRSASLLTSLVMALTLSLGAIISASLAWSPSALGAPGPEESTRSGSREESDRSSPDTSKPTAETSYTYWYFDGQLSREARRAVSTHYTHVFPHHIYGERALRAHLEATLRDRVKALKQTRDQPLSPALEACTPLLISKAAPQCDLDALSRRIFGLSARVYLHTSIEGTRRDVKMAIIKSDGSIKTYKASGDQLNAVLYSVVDRAFGVASYQVDGIPSEAQVSINGQAVGQGSGLHALRAGVNQIEISAPRYLTYKTQVEVKPGQRAVEQVKLTSAFGLLTIDIYNRHELRALKLTLDGKPVDLDALKEPLEVTPGEHVVSCSARDRQTLTQSFNIKAGQGVTWEVTLNYNRPLWKLELREAAPEARQQRQLISLSLLAQNLRAGAWEAAATGLKSQIAADTPDAMLAQSDSFSGGGLAAGFTWVVNEDQGAGAFRLNLLGLGYSYHGGGEVGSERRLSANAITLTSTRYTLEALHRVQTRIAWPGYQLSFGRFTSHVQAGLLWAYETGLVSAPDKGNGKVSDHHLRFGWEMGLRYHLDPIWSIESTFGGDVGAGRAVSRGSIGVVFATSLF